MSDRTVAIVIDEAHYVSKINGEIDSEMTWFIYLFVICTRVGVRIFVLRMGKFMK